MKSLLTALCMVVLLSGAYLLGSRNDDPAPTQRAVVMSQDYVIRDVEMASQPLDAGGFIGLAEILTADGVMHAEIVKTDGNIGLGEITLDRGGKFTSDIEIDPQMLSSIVRDIEARSY